MSKIYNSKKNDNKNESKTPMIVISIIAGIIVLALIVIGVMAVVLNGSNTSTTASSSSASSSVTSADSASYIDTATTTGKHHAEIDIKDYGTISVELDADSAPISVENFMNLANEGFYDGLTFHRIIKDFMMQGGDPKGTGTGGSDQNIKGEFSANGVPNELKNVRGAIAMARSSENNSASSQFYIVQKDASSLDGQYAVFGNVTDGMDIVDKICNETPEEDSNGTIASSNQPVINTIKIID